MQKLLSLSGPQQGGMTFERFLELDDLDAGIAFLTKIGQIDPTLTFGDLMAVPQRLKMGKKCDWWNVVCKSGNLISDVSDKTGDIIGGTLDYVGKKGGEVIRLATDEQVLDGASRIAAAYYTQGGTEAARGIFGSEKGGSMDSILTSLFSLFGAGAKQQTANQAGMDMAGFGASKTMVIVGGVLVGGLVIGALLKGGR